MDEKKNEKYPKRYRAEFIEPGIISYEDVSQGKVYLSREAMDKMLNSFVGKPVINWDHIDMTPEEAFKLSDKELETLADGIVSAVGKLENGWHYADLMIWNLSTQENIEKNGFSVSCAYIPTEVSGPGKYHGIDYDEEVIDGYYTHMAIVENPRYEASKIYLNSKGEKEMTKKFKFFWNSEEPKKEEKKDEEVMNAEDSVIEIDGEQIPLAELIKVWQAEKAEKKVLDNESEIDINGEKVKANELIEAYKKNKNKCNAEDPTTEKLEPVVEKQNSKNENFKKVENSVSEIKQNSIIVKTKADRIAEGKARYGLKVEVK